MLFVCQAGYLATVAVNCVFCVAVWKKETEGVKKVYFYNWLVLFRAVCQQRSEQEET